ncbi:NADPH-dependent FMN reductase [Streptomyces sp. cg2]|uniref:NADPH-dependent FMN reductase n=1 Tax=Streptomyces sp. cg2 TaxID=3238799 RepID=UPI0034E2F3CF
MNSTNPAHPLQVLGISGSLRGDSHNTTALRAVAALADPTIRLTMWNGLVGIPPFCEDHESEPAPAVRDLRTAFAEADSLLISTPEYNGSIPGQLKNALDWASRPYGASALSGKPVTIMSASPSAYGAQWAQDDLRKILTTCGAQVTVFSLAISQAHTAFRPDDVPHDPELHESLLTLLHHIRPSTRDTSAARR